jgi:DNA-binding protein YbaB
LIGVNFPIKLEGKNMVKVKLNGYWNGKPPYTEVEISKELAEKLKNYIVEEIIDVAIVEEKSKKPKTTRKKSTEKK